MATSRPMMQQVLEIEVAVTHGVEDVGGIGIYKSVLLPSH